MISLEVERPYDFDAPVMRTARAIGKAREAVVITNLRAERTTVVHGELRAGEHIDRKIEEIRVEIAVRSAAGDSRAFGGASRGELQA
jgi:hypothetical protein